MASFLRFLDNLLNPDTNNASTQESRARSRLTPKPSTPKSKRSKKKNQRPQISGPYIMAPPTPPTPIANARATGRLLDQHFTCALCSKTSMGTGIACGSSTTRICSRCFTTVIVPLFERAFQNDHARPVTFLGRILEPHQFAHTLEFPFRLLIQWNERENVRCRPMEVRLYCKNLVQGAKCGNFIGLKTPHYVGMAPCQACKRVVCSCCGHLLIFGRTHECVRGDDCVQPPQVGGGGQHVVLEGGELYPLEDRDTAGQGVLTTEERKARLWKWLEEVELPATIGRLD